MPEVQLVTEDFLLTLKAVELRALAATLDVHVQGLKTKADLRERILDQAADRPVGIFTEDDDSDDPDAARDALEEQQAAAVAAESNAHKHKEGCESQQNARWFNDNYSVDCFSRNCDGEFHRSWHVLSIHKHATSTKHVDKQFAAADAATLNEKLVPELKPSVFYRPRRTRSPASCGGALP